MKTITKTVMKLNLQTVNRGMKLFTVSKNDKGELFAHEIGEKTQFAKVFGGEDCVAHKLNPSVRYGNQYTRSWKPKPFKTFEQAISAIQERANSHVQYF